MDFLNGLATSFVLLLCFAAVAGVGVFLGISLRRRSNAKAEAAAGEDAAEA